MRRAVALNPSTPPPLLHILSRDHRIHVRIHAIENPRCPQHTIEGAAASLDHSACMSVARNRACPPHLLARFADECFYEYLRHCALSHPGCPPETLRRHARARRRSETRRLTLLDDRLRLPSAGSRKSRATACYRIAKDAARTNPGCPMSPLGRLRRLVASGVQRLGALWEGTAARPAAHRRLASSRAAPRSAPRTLDRLAMSADPWTRRDAALHPECPSALLARLAQDPHPVVHVAATSNPGCAPQTLDLLRSTSTCSD